MEQLSQIRSLSLQNTCLTDAGLSHHKSIANLDKLTLKWTKVTDAGIEDLRKECLQIKWTH